MKVKKLSYLPQAWAPGSCRQPRHSPKEMLPIVDKPTIQYIVEEAISSGIEEILIVTGRNKRAIEDHFDRSVELELELSNKHNHKLLAGNTEHIQSRRYTLHTSEGSQGAGAVR